MDLEQTLESLRRELELLTSTINQLEELQRRYASSSSRRGRQSMGAEERLQVSYRMKRYWASRRHAEQPMQAADATPVIRTAAG